MVKIFRICVFSVIAVLCQTWFVHQEAACQNSSLTDFVSHIRAQKTLVLENFEGKGLEEPDRRIIREIVRNSLIASGAFIVVDSIPEKTLGFEGMKTDSAKAGFLLKASIDRGNKKSSGGNPGQAAGVDGSTGPDNQDPGFVLRISIIDLSSNIVLIANEQEFDSRTFFQGIEMYRKELLNEITELAYGMTVENITSLVDRHEWLKALARIQIFKSLKTGLATTLAELEARVHHGLAMDAINESKDNLSAGLLEEAHRKLLLALAIADASDQEADLAIQKTIQDLVKAYQTKNNETVKSFKALSAVQDRQELIARLDAYRISQVQNDEFVSLSMLKQEIDAQASLFEVYRGLELLESNQEIESLYLLRNNLANLPELEDTEPVLKTYQQRKDKELEAERNKAKSSQDWLDQQDDRNLVHGGTGLVFLGDPEKRLYAEGFYPAVLLGWNHDFEINSPLFWTLDTGVQWVTGSKNTPAYNSSLFLDLVGIYGRAGLALRYKQFGFSLEGGIHTGLWLGRLGLNGAASTHQDDTRWFSGIEESASVTWNPLDFLGFRLRLGLSQDFCLPWAPSNQFNISIETGIFW